MLIRSNCYLQVARQGCIGIQYDNYVQITSEQHMLTDDIELAKLTEVYAIAAWLKYGYILCGYNYVLI